MREFQDKVAVVTGAAAGIGRATAIAFADRGTHLAIADVNAEGLAETKAIIGDRVRVTTHRVDVGNAEAMRRFRDDVVAAHGRVDVLVNNAGITEFGTFAEQGLDVHEQIIGVNLWGVLHGCRVFLPDLSAQPDSHIVNISSMAGFVGIPYQALYCTTKFAVRGLSQALRAELAGSGIGVTSVHPGAVRTGLLGTSGSADRGLSDKMADLMLRFGYPVERAGRKIVRAVRRNTRELRLAPESHATFYALRLIPGVVHWFMKLMMRSGDRLRTTPVALPLPERVATNTTDGEP